MPYHSLLDTPFSGWTYELIDEFLNAHIAEDERTDYKKDFGDHFPETLVSFANGSGGYIFVGVAEAREFKIPVKWPTLEPGKTPIATAYNKATSETTPPVHLHATAFVSPDGSGQIVVVKVDPGDFPPYHAKNNGTKIRVGDVDAHADPRALENLFSRREAFSEARERHRQAFETLVPYAPLAPHVVSDHPRLFLYAAPTIDVVPYRFGDSTVRELAQFGKKEARHLGQWWQEQRDSTGVEFDLTGSRRLAVRRNGLVFYQDRAVKLEPDSEGRPAIPAILILREIYEALIFVEHFHLSHTGYTGALYVGVALHDFGDSPLGFSSDPDGGPPFRRIPLRSLPRWTEDAVPHAVGDDPILTAREFVKSLCWLVGYEDYALLIDRWGEEVERGKGRA